VSSSTPPVVGTTVPRRSFGTKRVLLLVFGSLTVLVALCLLAAAGAGVWALGERDSSGYFTTGEHRLSTPAYALASENLDVDSDVPDWFGDHFATVRIQASATKPVFVGIAHTSDIDRYLSGVAHDEITDIDADPFKFESRHIEGSAKPGAPDRESFWRVQASGRGTQTITWPLEQGDWSALAMNADVSRGVAVDARFGVHVSALGWLTAGLFVLAGLILLGGATLLYFGARRPPSP
jgi:hypothetical protein